jgi:hypothetical protein
MSAAHGDRSRLRVHLDADARGAGTLLVQSGKVER